MFMSLSVDLISQFAKITNDKQPTVKETVMYGTAVKYNNEMYVRLDGSDMLTPIDTTVDVKSTEEDPSIGIKDGERVSVTLRNHTAVATGNASSPAARIDTVNEIDGKVTTINSTVETINSNVSTFNSTVETINSTVNTMNSTLNTVNSQIDIYNSSFQIKDGVVTGLKGITLDWITTEKLEASLANIDELTANSITTEYLNANYITADQIKTTYAEIKSLNALNGKIENLESGIITTDTLNATYANIDFANIGEAAIKKLFSDYGIIKNFVLKDGHVTGELNAVTVNGDLINANTLKADRLVIKGTDGLYYQLNTNGVDITQTQTDENSLNGQVIQAKSITASQIYVSDLLAFDATIAGFNMVGPPEIENPDDPDGPKIPDPNVPSKLYSGVKNSVNNTTSGIYLDDSGQMAIGDSNNFIKYYLDEEGNKKLEMSADSIKMGSESLVRSSDLNITNETIQSVVNDIEGMSEQVSQQYSQIEQTAGSISSTVSSIQETVDEMNDETVEGSLANQITSTKSELIQTSESITASFTDTINDKISPFEKFIKFTSTGISILQENGDENIELALDSGLIEFRKNGERLGWWDGDDFHTGNIVIDVNERAQFGNFAFKPRSDGSLSFLKVEDESES